MKMIVVLCVLISLVTVTLSGSAAAQYRQCLFDGEVYEDGDRVGPYICMDGEWVLAE